MEIILKESISKLGKAGDVVKVANGYARNYLFPKNLAVVADRKNVRNLERERQRILSKAAKLRDEHEALASRLAGIVVTIPVRVGDAEKLYGSVTSLDVARSIEQQGYQVDRRKILLDEPIRALGEYQVQIRLSAEVQATVSVKVVPETA